jgi:hypothetical protein
MALAGIGARFFGSQRVQSDSGWCVAILGRFWGENDRFNSENKADQARCISFSHCSG